MSEETHRKKVDDLLAELDHGTVYREEPPKKQKTSIDKNGLIALAIIFTTIMITILGVTSLIIWAVKG